jgi:hypothetical protein
MNFYIYIYIYIFKKDEVNEDMLEEKYGTNFAVRYYKEISSSFRIYIYMMYIISFFENF